MYKLRTLSGLLAFDAAARNGSLTLAANELGRTQSAVSQQVKALEQQLQLQLFVRRPREIELTVAGKALAEVVRRSLEAIEQTVNELSLKDEPNVLRLTTYQSFAIHWLIPRLPKFSLLHPEIDVRINADDQRRDLKAAGFDLSIRVGSLPHDVEALHQEVCAPVYAQSLTPLSSISCGNVTDYPLLAHKHMRRAYWQQWQSDNGGGNGDLLISSDYSHSGLLVQAAAAGGGIALAPLAIASDALQNGRLKCIKSTPVLSDHHYYIVTAQEQVVEKVKVFSDWIREEMVQMEEELTTHLS
ncbi:MAG: LysR family transcriptional regulator [Kordiimonadaceae bacterium]|nr:LysR family transcriptional regulator [Kordiimonadaceae bacterium]